MLHKKIGLLLPESMTTQDYKTSKIEGKKLFMKIKSAISNDSN